MDENPISAERLRAYVDRWLNRAKRTERIMLWVLHFLVFVIFFLGAQPLSPGVPIACRSMSSAWRPRCAPAS